MNSVDRKASTIIRGILSPGTDILFLRLGAFGIVFGLPVLIYSVTFFCNDVSGCPAPSLLHPSNLSIDKLKTEIGWPDKGIKAFYDTQVTLLVLGYYLLSLFLQVFLPGQEAEGVQLACGGRHKYKLNGIHILFHFLCSNLTPYFF